jgi:hypothetical protein
MKAYKSAAIRAGKMVQLGTHSSPSPPEIPEGAIITSDEDYIKTASGDYILAGIIQVPNNALITPTGDYIKTANNEFITI